MSILIKGIDMPTNCTRCPCSNDETRYCRAANKYIPMLGKPSFCPLEEAEERKTGKWLPDNNSVYKMRFICSECRESQVVPTTGFTKYKPIWDFCPLCGAKMEVEHEG